MRDDWLEMFDTEDQQEIRDAWYARNLHTMSGQRLPRDPIGPRRSRPQGDRSSKHQMGGTLPTVPVRGMSQYRQKEKTRHPDE